MKDNSLVDTIPRTLSTSGEDWIPFGNNTNILAGDTVNDLFGYSTALSDDGLTLAAGAIYNAGNGENAGHVKILRKIGNSWSQIGEDIEGEEALDFFGESLSLSGNGNIVAIGATSNDGNGTNSGHVRVYAYNTTSWVKLGSDIDGEEVGDKSGSSVSLSHNGKTVAIGAIGNDYYSGHVRVYAYNNISWVQIGGDIDGDFRDDSSGYSVSLSSDGTIVAIGAPYSDYYTGHVKILRLVGISWSQIGNDIDGEILENIDGETLENNSGSSVSLSSDGTIVAIGAHANDYYSGHVRVYAYITASWVQLGEDIDGEAILDNFGYSVSLSGDGMTVAIGAYNSAIGNGINAGHTRIYTYNIASWVQLGEDIVGAAGDQSGSSVSLSRDGSIVAIGAPYGDANDGIMSGRVRVYTRVSTVDLFPVF